MECDHCRVPLIKVDQNTAITVALQIYLSNLMFIECDHCHVPLIKVQRCATMVAVP